MLKTINDYRRTFYESITSLNNPKFICPFCSYKGQFKNLVKKTGFRKNARCPQCKSLERHRLQKLVLDTVFADSNLCKQKILHCAPEPFLTQYLKPLFTQYVTADLCREDVDIQCDLTQLPFADQEFDCLYASHVLEHIKDDQKALAEIKRVLKPNGIAILPVPIVEEITIEYPEPNPSETYHVRAPGKDYYQRYQQVFSKVKIYSSLDFDDIYQPFIYEDRSHYPNPYSPLRNPSKDIKHLDFVPICFK